MKAISGQVNWSGIVDGNFEEVESRSFGTSTTNIYVNSIVGDDNNDGSLVNPFKTISKALVVARRYNNHGDLVIYIADGIYNEDISIRNCQHIYIYGTSQSGTIINGYIYGYQVNKYIIKNLTINVPTVNSHGIHLEAVTYGYIENVTINQVTYGTIAFGACISSQSSIVYVVNCILTGGKRCVQAGTGGILHVHNSNLNNNNIVAEVQLGGKVSLGSCTKNVYDTLYNCQSGCIFLDGVYIGYKTANVTN